MAGWASKRAYRGAWLVVGLAMLLAGCNFKLREAAALPFANAWVEAPTASALAPGLRNSLQLQGKLAETMAAAPVQIHIGGEKRTKEILSLSSAGKVREYRLGYAVTLVALRANGERVGEPITVEQVRDYTYDDALVQAAASNEALLYRAMEQEALRQSLRRLAYLRF